MVEATRPVLLLDLDGVLLDNHRYTAEWNRLADAAFAPLLGAHGSWGETTDFAWREVSRAGMRELSEQSPDQRPPPAAWWDTANDAWISEVCRRAALVCPPTREERIAVAERALQLFFHYTEAFLPDVAPAVRLLAERCELHMASGNPAWVVEIVLDRLGVRGCVGEPFGSDLAGAHKHLDDFYPAILERIGGAPAGWIVVDDEPAPLGAARRLGARTVGIGPGGADADLALAGLAELPERLEALL